MKEIKLNNLKVLEIKENYQISYGGNQAWYSKSFERQSGCGPTTATNLFYYLSKPHYNIPKSEMIYLMNQMFTYIKPGLMGVNSVKKFNDGAIEYIKAKQLVYQSKSLEIKPHFFKQVPLDSIRDFLINAISNDLPVAFLNLNASRVHNLSSWHWVLIVGIIYDEDNLLIQIYDEGYYKKIDFKLWYNSTNLGGGLIYFQ